MDGLPPKQFDHPYNGPVIERRMTHAEIEKMCPGIRNIVACSYSPTVQGHTCYIFMPFVGKGGISQRYWDQIHRHEIGHCNGWRHE